MSKTMNVGKLLITAAVIVLLNSGSASIDISRGNTVNKDVAIILKMNQGDYLKTIKMGAYAAAKEFHVDLQMMELEDDEDLLHQIDSVQKSDKIKALILAANDYKGLSEVCLKVNDLRIPVITIDLEVESPKVKSRIGINNYEAGKQAGKKSVELIGGRGSLAVVNFGKGAQNIEQRERGLLDEIAQFPNVQIIENAYCYSIQQLCKESVKKMIRSDKSIDGIVALDAVSSVGVVNEIKEMGLEGKLNVVTFDSTLEELQWLQEGVIQATIIQNSFIMGYFGVKYAVEAVDHKKIPERMNTDAKIIDMDNMFWADNQKLLFPFVK